MVCNTMITNSWNYISHIVYPVFDISTLPYRGRPRGPHRRPHRGPHCNLQHKPGLKGKFNDIVTMKLDCTNWRLSYQVNENGICKTVNGGIKEGKYRATVRMMVFGSSCYELLSYQMTY